MKFSRLILCMTLMALVKMAYCQTENLHDTLYRDKVVISPNPIIGGEYFKIKFPERSVLKQLELIDLSGNKIEASPILFSKMGMYMPKIKSGEYLLRIDLQEDTIVKKVWVK